MSCQKIKIAEECGLIHVGYEEDEPVFIDKEPGDPIFLGDKKAWDKYNERLKDKEVKF